MPGRNNTRKCLFCEKRMCKHARSKIVYPDLRRRRGLREGGMVIKRFHIRCFSRLVKGIKDKEIRMMLQRLME